MRRARLLPALLLAALAACNPPAAPAETMSATEISQELQRCRALGLKFYDDVKCRAAQSERTKRFYAGPREAPR